MQQTKFGFAREYKKEYGGELGKGRRKTVRPLSTKEPLHLTLKSTKVRLFNPAASSLDKIIKDHAKKYQIKVYELALNWNHIHFAIRVPSRNAYKAFIRTLTSAIVRILSKASGRNLKGLFDLRPHTKIVSWGRQFKNLIAYIVLNQKEARGKIKRKKNGAKIKNRDSEPTKNGIQRKRNSSKPTKCAPQAAPTL